MKIAVNSFCMRQTPESKYSHFEGTWDELVELVQNHFDGSDEGVVAVDVPPAGFFSGVTKLTEDSVLSAEFSARRKGEEPYVQITATGNKIPARSVEIIVYSHETLAKDGDNTTEAEWEIVSINASASATGSEPPTPVAMARNFLEMAGGTKREYTAKEFAESILYWSQHAMIG
jgi:hypothetical protein